MESELCIPTDRVPPEILQKLKQIGLLLRSEALPPSAPASCSQASPAGPSTTPRKDDERDDLERSGSRGHSSVVHVLGPDTVKDATPKDSDVVSLFAEARDRDSGCVVSLFGQRTGTEGVVNVLEERTEVEAGDLLGRRRDGDVVSLLDPAPSDVPQNHPHASAMETIHGMKKKEQEAVVLESRSSPLKDVVNQNCRWSHPQAPRDGSGQFSVSSQGGQQYPSPQPYAAQLEVPEQYVLRAQKHPRSSPSQALSCQEAEEERCLVSGRSPCKTPKRYEDSIISSISSSSRQQHHSVFDLRSDSPSMSTASSSSSAITTTATTTTPSPSQSSRSRSPPSHHPSCSNSDDLLHPGCLTPSKDCGQKSPKVLTPPETPENDGKRVVPEVFTFDDLSCTQERLRQTWERLQKLHDQFTPTKRSPSSSATRHPPSTPTTPSFRRHELLPSSPQTLRRISPVDQHLLQRLEASPQPKLKTSELPGSPAPALPSTPQRLLPVDSYSPPRRDSLSHSPKPKKRLSFDEEGVSSQLLLQQQVASRSSRTFDTSPAPYPPAPSPRPSGSGAESLFPFPAYSGDGGQQRFGRAGPGKPALAFADFQKKMTSLAAFREGREDDRDEDDDDDDDDERRGPFFSDMRHVYETIEFQSRLAMQNGRYTPKRKRSDLMDDGSDGPAMCTCAVMERNFLQMAECAYKRIRRTDATPADFDRFRNELAQTNEILRESMGLMKHIRDLCDHRKRPRW